MLSQYYWECLLKMSTFEVSTDGATTTKRKDESVKFRAATA